MILIVVSFALITAALLYAQLICRSLLSAFIILEPFDPFAHLPNSLTLLALLYVDAFSVLLSLVPLALIATTVGPRECSVAVLLVIFVLAHVLSAVTPREDAATLHPVVDPVTLVYSAVCPDVFAHTMNIVLIEIAIVRTLITPNELALSVLHALDVFT